MKYHICTFVFILSLIGCATQPKYQLVKNVSQQEVNQDNAACQNQAQLIQIADWAFKGSILEGANIQAKQNVAYENCLISKGYTRKTLEVHSPNSTYFDQLNYLTEMRKSLCDKPEYKELFEKTTCDGKGITLKKLTDKSKITNSQKIILKEYLAEYERYWEEQKTLVKHYGTQSDKEYIAYVDNFVWPSKLINITDLYDGKKTWGEYNKEAMRIVASDQPGMSKK